MSALSHMPHTQVVGDSDNANGKMFKRKKVMQIQQLQTQKLRQALIFEAD